ncbi:MAG TPA: hypothetical protein ENI98_00935 [Gammaproteobacteria bacterium]|nr:hypothetical protein [Gammaproteobacteria bacterium]
MLKKFALLDLCNLIFCFIIHWWRRGFTLQEYVIPDIAVSPFSIMLGALSRKKVWPDFIWKNGNGILLLKIRYLLIQAIC